MSANSSVCEGPSSPVQVEHPMEVEATHSQEVESLKRLLQEVCEREEKCEESVEIFYLQPVLKSCSLSSPFAEFQNFVRIMKRSIKR